MGDQVRHASHWSILFNTRLSLVRSNDRRNQLTLREGEQRRGYRGGKYRSVRNSRHPDR